MSPTSSKKPRNSHPFAQVDVFTKDPRKGNPVAVVFDADDLSDAQMQEFASWTNLSETTFVLTPTDPKADYRLRIFTPTAELPFAGHPTLGSAHAWLDHRGERMAGIHIVQECGIGLVELNVGKGAISFIAPPLLRSGPVEAREAAALLGALGLDPGLVEAVEWVDNGPGFAAVLVDSAETVLALTPDFSALPDAKVGVIGRYPAEGPADFEARVFVPGVGVAEDPVTGSFNAGAAVWLYGSSRVAEPYVVSQGTVLGRHGRVKVRREDETIWVGGASRTLVSGTVVF